MSVVVTTFLGCVQSQMVLEEQIGDQQKALEKTHNSTSKQDTQKKQLEDELSAVKRVFTIAFVPFIFVSTQLLLLLLYMPQLRKLSLLFVI